MSIGTYHGFQLIGESPLSSTRTIMLPPCFRAWMAPFEEFVRLLSWGAMIGSALAQLAMDNAFYRSLSLGIFGVSVLAHHMLNWRAVAYFLFLPVILMLATFAVMLPCPDLTVIFVLQRLPLLITVLNLIMEEVFRRMTSPGQPADRSPENEFDSQMLPPSPTGRCSPLDSRHLGFMGGAHVDDPEPIIDGVSDISLSRCELASIPSSWPSQVQDLLEERD
jgi:hypothetical protein